MHEGSDDHAGDERPARTGAKARLKATGRVRFPSFWRARRTTSVYVRFHVRLRAVRTHYQTTRRECRRRTRDKSNLSALSCTRTPYAAMPLDPVEGWGNWAHSPKRFNDDNSPANADNSGGTTALIVQRYLCDRGLRLWAPRWKRNRSPLDADNFVRRRIKKIVHICICISFW